ncbi:MAG TPA: acyl-CoA dehydrogenase family protein, partial [Planctomycetaceae bacterium]|nr:acyl-CoA dehydrogenase family protein [Planctomycetaceae bacterium]
MTYQLDETGRQLVGQAARLAHDVAGRHAADVDRAARFPSESLAALARDGLFGLSVPSESGGRGQPPRVFAGVVEELAQACASTAMVYVMHVSAAQVIAASATLAGRDELLREIAAGRHLTTLAFSEAGSRSQFWAPVSRLERQAGGNGEFVTTARKSWVTSATQADSFVSSARNGNVEASEVTLYVVRRGSAGLRIDGGFDGLGLRGNDSAPTVLESVRIPASDLLSEPGGGAAMMLEIALPWFSVGTAAMANGLCRAAVTATAAHLTGTGFEHTGTQLRDLANLRSRLAEMSVRTEQSRALLAATVTAMEHPDAATPLLVLQSRLAAIQAAVDVTDLAMKACGGAAFSRHLGIERLFRDARAGWVMSPTADHLLDFIGRALTGI